MFGPPRDRLDELMALERGQPLAGPKLQELLRELAAMAFDSRRRAAKAGCGAGGLPTSNPWLRFQRPWKAFKAWPRRTASAIAWFWPAAPMPARTR